MEALDCAYTPMKIKAEKDNKKMDSANKFLKKAAFRQFVSNSIS
ncbi:hypothetical protein HMPREF0083_05374 [Aneurinibacillus aneurinilyticus ATCC 12856]|jgi:hypothetical protein|uniref:Uncharacterized protein n=1 Tax=Aneurinibacillus aneurinilyticus ATCC 12856 TaxID=649747 RepID=U1WVJ0_ANEAE|nr:hypothetical protein HMPREF0083_05374 [Aneurinibacillus aneurinilyticus ATCC 12856]